MQREIEAAGLRDKRLKKRLALLVDKISEAPQETLPEIFGRWGDVKAAYRFFRQ